MSFQQDLWDGFGIVSNQVTSDVDEAAQCAAFLKRSADFESTQAKNLRKLMRDEGGGILRKKSVPMEGTLPTAWEAVQQQMESLAVSHEQTGERLLEEIHHDLAEAVTDLQAQLKKVIALGQKQEKTMEDAFNAHESRRAGYYSACDDHLRATQAFEAGQDGEKAAKLQSAMDKALDKMQSSEEAYKKAVETLNSTAAQFFQVLMPGTLQELEDIDRRRGAALNTALSKLVGTLEGRPDTCNEVVDCLRQAAGEVNVDTDIFAFLDSQGEIGSNMEVEFEDWEAGKTVDAPTKVGGGGGGKAAISSFLGRFRK